MKTQLKSSKTCMLLVFFTLAIISNSYAAEITVGDAKINVPPFSGFSEISSISNETFETFQDLCPPINRLLAVFLTQDDVGRILLGKPAILNRYMVVQSSKELETLTLSKYQFKEFREILRNQNDVLFKETRESLGQMAEKAGEVFSDRLGIEMAFKLGDVVPLGVDSETTSSITISQLAKYNIKTDSENVEFVMAGTTTALLVKGKVINLYVFKQYHAEEDIEWVRKTAKEYTKQILSANETTWPLATGSIVPEGTSVDPITKELLAGKWIEYNLKSHPKADGLDITLKYPQSWKAEEGIRPHIVQKFTGQPTGGITPMCIVLVRKMPIWARLFLKGEIAEEVLTESVQEFVPEGAVFIDSGQTKIDGEPCVWLKYYHELERAGVRGGMYVLQYVLFYNGRMFVVECAVGGIAEDKGILEDAFNSYLPVFQTIGSSIVITGKWTKPDKTAKFEDSIMEEAFGEYWLLSLLVSAILTWGIGLTPPILIRYAILRRPLPKKAAIPIVIFFGFVNIVIFTALGSQSKTHAALFLVALASYYILHRKYASWQREGIQTNPGKLAPKAEDDNTVKSASNVEQVDNNNRKIMTTPIAAYIEKELDKTVHRKYEPSVTSESINNQSKNSTKAATETPPQEENIVEEAPPKTEPEPMMSGRLEKCSNCKRTIGKLEHSYELEGNIVCVKCYQVLNSEND